MGLGQALILNQNNSEFGVCMPMVLAATKQEEFDYVRTATIGLLDTVTGPGFKYGTEYSRNILQTGHGSQLTFNVTASQYYVVLIQHHPLESLWS